VLQDILKKNMADLNKNTELLIAELYNYFIFYLPKEAIINAFEQYGIKAEDLQLLEANFNKVNYIHQSNWFLFDEDPFDISELTFKTINLSKNTFKLFEFKESLQAETFQFILEKYVEQVEFYFNVATLLVENYEQYCPFQTKELKKIIELQQLILKNHLTEVQNKFIPSTTYINLSKISNSLNFKQELVNSSKEIKKYIFDKKKVKNKLTKDDAVDFLLKTVFVKKGN
jgi:hypothetical protein